MPGLSKSRGKVALALKKKNAGAPQKKAQKVSSVQEESYDSHEEETKEKAPEEVGQPVTVSEPVVAAVEKQVEAPVVQMAIEKSEPVVKNSTESSTSNTVSMTTNDAEVEIVSGPAPTSDGFIPWNTACCGGVLIHGTDKCMSAKDLALIEKKPMPKVDQWVCNCSIKPKRFNFEMHYHFLLYVHEFKPYESALGHYGKSWDDFAVKLFHKKPFSSYPFCQGRYLKERFDKVMKKLCTEYSLMDSFDIHPDMTPFIKLVNSVAKEQALHESKLKLLKDEKGEKIAAKKAERSSCLTFEKAIIPLPAEAIEIIDEEIQEIQEAVQVSSTINVNTSPAQKVTVKSESDASAASSPDTSYRAKRMKYESQGVDAVQSISKVIDLTGNELKLMSQYRAERHAMEMEMIRMQLEIHRQTMELNRYKIEKLSKNED